VGIEMKASELRIGNYVNDSIGLITIGLNGNIKFADAYHPIPLTEEWLLKFGFKLDIDSSYHKRDVSVFLDKRFKTNLYLQSNESNFVWFGYELRVDYVHQLQNLYFALTQEEL
jgi:hypothetical protein